jgi:predicted DNA-binding protein with PD1-like motif
MDSHELTTGRTFGARFDPDESFFPALENLCREKGVRRGYIPMFLAAFCEADIVEHATSSMTPPPRSGQRST